MKKFLSFIFALMMCLTAQATSLSDLKFGQAQIADSQWNVSACTQTTTCQIYSKNPGTVYKIPWTSGKLTWAAGDYVAFATTGNSTNPFNAIQYSANGAQKAVLGTGHIINMGNDYFFFVGNDNNTGQLFSMTQGFNNTSGVSWTGTLNPTVAQVNAYAANGSTTPLAAGQTAQPSAPASPTVTGTSTSNEVGSSSSTGPTETTSNTYQWGGGTYSIIGTSTPTTITTTTTPVTTTTYSDGSTNTSSGNSTTTSNTTWDYTVTGPTNPPVSPNVGTNKNSVYITQTNAGASNNITANQSGRGNYESVSLGGSNNIVRLGQGYTFNTTGASTESANASNYNLSSVTVSGNFNGVVNSQVGNSNSAIISSTGTYNSLLATQTGNNNQVYSTISGNNNSLSFGQNGNGNIAATNLYGNNNVASITQTGNNHGTVLNLINAGGANNVSVIQTGTGDAYSLQQTCTNPAGCSVSVIRNK
jgi:hypothetical protein